MNASKTKHQLALVSRKYCQKYAVGTLATMIMLVSTPTFSHAVSTPNNALTNTQIALVLSNKSSKAPRQIIYICSPAGFGQKSSCYKR